MAAFLLTISKTGKEINKKVLSAAFNRQENELVVQKVSNATLYVLKFGSVMDDTLLQINDSYSFVQGFMRNRDSLKRALHLKILENTRIKAWDISTPCVHLFLSSTLVRVQNGLGCGEVCFYFENNDFIFFTNQIKLLSQVAILEIRQESMIAYAGRTHSVSQNTLFKGVKRIVGGDIVRVDLQTSQIQILKPNIAESIDTMDIKEAIEKVVALYSNYLNDDYLRNSEKIIDLSGGKDSRGILAILEKNGLVDGGLMVRTIGEDYSPEVLAAKLVTNKYSNIRHIIQPRSVPSNFTYNQLIRSTINAVYACDAGISLADMGGIAYGDNINFGGHENGLKSKRNANDLEKFLQNSKQILNAGKFLTKEAQNVLENEFENYITPYLKGLQANQLEIVVPLFARNSIWVAQTNTMVNIGSCIIHPYLDYELSRIIISSPKELTSTQLLHFSLMSMSSKGIVNLPFCADSFPKTLFPLLQKLQIPFNKNLYNVLPFTFNEHYPTEKRFGFLPKRIIMLGIFSKWIGDFIQARSNSFGFLNENFLNTLKKDPKQINHAEMYRILGMLVCCLYYEYGNALFAPKNHQEICDDLKSQLAKTSTMQVPRGIINPIESKDYNTCIAHLAQENHRLQTRIASLSPLNIEETPYVITLDTKEKKNLNIECYFSKDKEIKIGAGLMKIVCDGKDKELEGFAYSAGGGGIMCI